jgi:hypothetical protein
MEVGEEWAYRLRSHAPSERVRVLEIERRKQSTRAVVEFLGDARNGRIENVPAGRLRVPWSEVTAFDVLMANWQRIDDYKLSQTEEHAVGVVFEQLIPDDVAGYDTGGAYNVGEIKDDRALEMLVRRPVSELVAAVPSFQHEGSWWLSAEGTLLLAEAACRVNPIPILIWVTEEERKCREAVKHGAERVNLDGERYTSEPDWEYELYRRLDLPVHEILREWCGHRAVSFHERLAAAEAEVHRLDELLARAADALRDNKLDHLAAWLDEEHECDRITPYNVRPTIDRPLDPAEIPVQVEYRRAWWR